MVADVTDHVDEREVAVAKPPLAVDAFESVVVATGDDGLQRKLVGLLQHRVVIPRKREVPPAATRGAGVLIDLDDRIGRHILVRGVPSG